MESSLVWRANRFEELKAMLLGLLPKGQSLLERSEQLVDKEVDYGPWFEDNDEYIAAIYSDCKHPKRSLHARQSRCGRTRLNFRSGQ